jgi:hypothetical protein
MVSRDQQQPEYGDCCIQVETSAGLEVRDSGLYRDEALESARQLQASGFHGRAVDGDGVTICTF